MTWFEKLTGFPELSPARVRQNLTLDGPRLLSRVNGNALVWGRLEIPTLAELREDVRAGGYAKGKLSLREVVANVQHLHADAGNADALFQVASQFNLLEMASPHATPELGVGIYEGDPTQGPACAIAAGAGTIYRNYFVNVNGQTGQSAHNQIDCLADLGAALGNAENRLWEMRNGYAFATQSGLGEITQRLQTASESEVDSLRQLLRVGIQWQTQVTLPGAKHTVSQAYCSALPIGYSSHPPHLWVPFARLVLEASYEATLCAALVNARSHGSDKLFLTLVGGGVFRNEKSWILDAIQRALYLYKDAELDVAIVSYGSSDPAVRQFVNQSQW